MRLRKPLPAPAVPPRAGDPDLVIAMVGPERYEVLDLAGTWHHYTPEEWAEWHELAAAAAVLSREARAARRNRERVEAMRARYARHGADHRTCLECKRWLVRRQLTGDPDAERNIGLCRHSPEERAMLLEVAGNGGLGALRSAA